MKTRIDGIKVETDGNYKIGYTMCTEQTRKWTDEQINANNDQEHRMIFVDFEPDDQGKGRRLIAKCDTTGQAINVMTAIRTTRLDARFELADLIHKLVSTHELKDQPDEMIQTAISVMTKAHGKGLVVGSHNNEVKNMQALLDARAVLEEIGDDWRTQ